MTIRTNLSWRLWHTNSYGILTYERTTKSQSDDQTLSTTTTTTTTTTKRACKIVDFTIPAVHWVKFKESEKKDKYLDLAKGPKNTLEHEIDDYTNCNRCSFYSHRRIDKGTGRLGNNRTSGEHPNYYIIEISQNTEKSPRDMRRLVIPQTPVKDH